MCNRYLRGEATTIRERFGAQFFGTANEGPLIVHPKEPGLIVRLIDGERVIEQMTWGLPVALRGKKGEMLKPKPVNNARFDKLGSFWKR